MSLNILNNFKQEQVVNSCLRFIDDKGVILLIEDGVFLAMENNTMKKKLLQKLVLQNRVFALLEDLEARGILDFLDKKIQKVDYTGFVKLTEKYKKIISWY